MYRKVKKKCRRTKVMLKKKNETLKLEHKDPENDVVFPNVQKSEEKIQENKNDVKEKMKP